MTYRAAFRKYTLRFKQPMGTSRGTLHERETFLLSIESDGKMGVGECAPLTGLSPDLKSDVEAKLREICEGLDRGELPRDADLRDWPAVQFSLESALRDLQTGGRHLLFESGFTLGKASLATNGLVVMAEPENMFRQVKEKVAAGFHCIKIKVGALDFDAECHLLQKIRAHFPPEQIELRLDANGAFGENDVLEKLERLAQFEIHSIEQPVKTRQWDAMAYVCRHGPIPVAWDEELIGISDPEEKMALVEAFRPSFLVLKPTLLGGFKACEEWVAVARKFDVGFWVTSALESNIGLNFISQWAATLDIGFPQGLGTGQLFQQNFPSPLLLQNGRLHFSPQENIADLTLENLHLQ